MKFTFQNIVGIVIGLVLTLFGVGLLSPEAGVSQSTIAPILAALITGMGVAIIGASVLSGTNTVSSKKIFGLSVEASGGIGLFVITLAFIVALNPGTVEPGKKDNDDGKPVPQNVLFEYQTYCDQCCAANYPALLPEQCPIRGVGISTNEQQAMDRAVEQCNANGGTWEGCGNNLTRIVGQE